MDTQIQELVQANKQEQDIGNAVTKKLRSYKLLLDTLIKYQELMNKIDEMETISLNKQQHVIHQQLLVQIEECYQQSIEEQALDQVVDEAAVWTKYGTALLVPGILQDTKYQDDAGNFKEVIENFYNKLQKTQKQLAIRRNWLLQCSTGFDQAKHEQSVNISNRLTFRQQLYYFFDDQNFNISDNSLGKLKLSLMIQNTFLNGCVNCNAQFYLLLKFLFQTQQISLDPEQLHFYSNYIILNNQDVQQTKQQQNYQQLLENIQNHTPKTISSSAVELKLQVLIQLLNAKFMSNKDYQAHLNKEYGEKFQYLNIYTILNQTELFAQMQQLTIQIAKQYGLFFYSLDNSFAQTILNKQKMQYSSQFNDLCSCIFVLNNKQYNQMQYFEATIGQGVSLIWVDYNNLIVGKIIFK